MKHLKKGSPEAKAYMARLRAMRGKGRKKSKSKTVVKEVKHKMGRRKGRARRFFSRHKKLAINLPAVGAVGYGVAEPIQQAMNRDLVGALKTLARNYSGFDWDSMTWNPLEAKGTLALGGAMIVHKGLSWLGVNRWLAQNGIPIRV